MPLNRCGSVSARLSVCLSAFNLAAKSSSRASRTSSPPGSMAASAASPSTRWIEARRFVPASVSSSVALSNSNTASHMRPGGFAPLASQRRRPAIIRWSTRNSPPSSSKTMRLPIRRRPKTFLPSADAMGGFTLRRTKGLRSRKRVNVRPVRRVPRCSIYTTTSGSSGIGRALHNFTRRTNPAYPRPRDFLPRGHVPHNFRKGRTHGNAREQARQAQEILQARGDRHAHRRDRCGNRLQGLRSRRRLRLAPLRLRRGAAGPGSSRPASRSGAQAPVRGDRRDGRAEAAARADRETGGEGPAAGSREGARRAQAGGRAPRRRHDRPRRDRGAARRANPARRAGVEALHAGARRRRRGADSRAAQADRRAHGELRPQVAPRLSLSRNSATLGGMAERILLIEDDSRLAEMVSEYLGESGFRVSVAAGGRAGLERLAREPFDALVLDLMLPDMDGLEVCRQLRAKSDTPVLMLTARGDATDRIVGLEIGADDYLPKPFQPRELLARLRAVLRRKTYLSKDQILRFGRLEIDRDARAVRLDGEARALTGFQFALLVALAENAGRVLSREVLMDLLKGEPLEAFDRSIDVHVSRLRAAIEDAPR